jgi:hypothetical protein
MTRGVAPAVRRRKVAERDGKDMQADKIECNWTGRCKETCAYSMVQALAILTRNSVGNPPHKSHH